MMFQNMFVVVFVYLATHVVPSAGTQCYPINLCEQIGDLPFDGQQAFNIATDQWINEDSCICPRSDTSITHWEVFFKDSSINGIPPITGSYCSEGVQFSPSDVCINHNGTTLTFMRLNDYYNVSGIVDINFSGTSFSASMPIRFSPTGVNANPSLVHILSNTDNIPLVWYVFNPNQITDYRVVYNGKTIANVTSSTNGYSIVYRDKTKCQRSTSSEITEVCSMLLMDLSPSSVGEYTLIADEYTGIVTVVLDSSYFIAAVQPTPSVSQVPSTQIINPSTTNTDDVTSSDGHVSSSLLHVSTSTSTVINTDISLPTTTQVNPPTSATNSLLTITLVCVSVGVTFCLLVAILLIILLVLKRKGNNRKSVEDGQEDVYRRKKISVAGQNFELEEVNNNNRDNEGVGNADEIDGKSEVCSHGDIKSIDVQHNPNDKLEDSDDVTGRVIFAEIRTLRGEMHERLDEFQGIIEVATVGVKQATDIDTDVCNGIIVDTNTDHNISSTKNSNEGSSSSSTDNSNSNIIQVSSEQSLPSALNGIDVSDVTSHDHSSTQLLRDSDSMSGGIESSSIPSLSASHQNINSGESRDEEEGDSSCDAGCSTGQQHL